MNAEPKVYIKPVKDSVSTFRIFGLLARSWCTTQKYGTIEAGLMLAPVLEKAKFLVILK